MASRSRLFSKIAKDVGSDGNLSAAALSPDVSFGATVYDSTGLLPYVGNDTGDQAYVKSNNRFYIWDSAGWYNVALINKAPNIASVLDSDGGTSPFALAIDGTATTITITATDSDGDPITYSATTDGNFSGLATLSQDGNTFTITPLSQDSATTVSSLVTFKATDGVNISSASSTFTLNFMSALWDETVLSIGTSSTNSLANSTFIDRSTNTHTISTGSQPVNQSAFHPYLDNWSVEFDGASYLNTGNANIPASGDFTVEFWYMSIDLSHRNDIISQYTAATDGRLAISQSNASSGVEFYNSRSGAITTTTIPKVGEWNHFAYVRDGDTFRAFVNGVQEATGTGSGTIDTATNTFIGFTTTQNYTEGFVSDVRISNIARYDANGYAVPAKLTSDVNTVLLTCQSNRFVDNSSNTHSITIVGTPEVSAHNPFGQGSEYALGENKGSLYIENGGNRYISFPPAAFTGVSGTAFTLEMWVYPMQYGTDYGHLVHRNWSGNNNFSWGISPTGYLSLWFNHTGLRMDNATHPVKLKQWNHVALGRDGSNFAFFLNGEVIQTGTYAGNIDTSRSDQFYVGVYPGYNIANTSHNAYFSDLKITGSDLYGVGGSSYTIPTSPVGNTNAEIYLPMDNAGIYDKTGNNTLTFVGNTSTSTTQTKYATTSIAFDGSGDVLQFPYGYLDNSNWTVEFWVYQNSAAACTLMSQGGSNVSALSLSAGGQFTIQIFRSGNQVLLQNAGSFQAGQWNHVALVCDGTWFRLYLNGTSIGSVQTNTSYPWNQGYSASQLLKFGVYDYNGSSYLNGYMENIQILKGVAKYGATTATNFTPPTQTQGRSYQAES